MSDEKKDATDETPEQLTDEQLDEVVGAGKFTQAPIMTAATVGAGVGERALSGGPGTVAQTVFTGVGNDTINARVIKGIDKLKR